MYCFNEALVFVVFSVVVLMSFFTKAYVCNAFFLLDAFRKNWTVINLWYVIRAKGKSTSQYICYYFFLRVVHQCGPDICQITHPLGTFVLL